MNDPRGQSSTLSVVLLIGIILTTATAIAVIGGGLVGDISGTAEQERAGQEMTQFASESAAVALGGSDQRQTQFDASAGTVRVRENASWICVENGSTSDREFILPNGTNVNNDATCGEEKTYMGSVVYDTGGETVAYEGGGVWSGDDSGGSRMVSPPEFHYRGDTLTLPVVNVSGDVDRSGSEVDLRVTSGSTEKVDHGGNPLTNNSGRVYVTVGSQYYEAWGEFMADRTDGRVVEFDHDNETVTVELVVPSPPEINQAIYTGSGGDDALDVNTGIVDSYDSSDSPHRYEPPNNNGSAGSIVTDGGLTITDTVHGSVYSIRQGGPIDVTGGTVNGSIHGQQSVDLSSGSDVNGSVYADGKVTLGGGGETINGDIHTDDEIDADSGVINGSVYANDGGTITSGSVDGEVHTDGGLVVDGGTFARPVYVDGNFKATGATFEDAVHVNGTVTQIDGTDFESSLYVDGDVDELSSSGNEPTVDGDVHITGDATITAVTINGSLTVEGDDVTCDSGLVVKEQVRFDDSSAGSDCPSSDGDPNPVQPTESGAPENTTAPDEPVVDPPTIELPDDSELLKSDDLPSDCTASGEAIVVDGGTCELDPGKYKISKLDLDGNSPSSNNLVAKTQSNADDTVELYVNGDVSITQDAAIRTGDSGHQNASELEINVYDEDASVDIQSNVTGVVNAPDSTVDIKSGAHVHGAVVADSVNTDGGGGVHYDEALSGQTVGNGQGDSTTVRYLHVTKNEIQIED